MLSRIELEFFAPFYKAQHEHEATRDCLFAISSVTGHAVPVRYAPSRDDVQPVPSPDDVRDRVPKP